MVLVLLLAPVKRVSVSSMRDFLAPVWAKIANSDTTLFLLLFFNKSVSFLSPKTSANIKRALKIYSVKTHIIIIKITVTIEPSMQFLCLCLHLTPDMWHLTCDTLHVIPDIWHVVGDEHCVQLPSYTGLGVMIFWSSGGKVSATDRLNYLISDRGVCRTAPATPGLLNIWYSFALCI